MKKSRYLFVFCSAISSIPEKIDSLKKNKKTQKFEGDNSQEKIDGPEQYKTSLLLKLKRYAQKFELNFELKSNHIKKFSQINNVTQCVVQCCFCSNETPCTFTTYWQISNLTKHIRGHLENPVKTNTPTLAPTSTPAQSSTGIATSAPTPLVIERTRVNVLKQIDNISSSIPLDDIP